MTGPATAFVRVSTLIAFSYFALASASAISAPLPARALSQHASEDPTPAEVRAQRAKARLQDNRPAQDRAAAEPHDLPPVDPALIDFFEKTVTELADPAYEGREPGSAGIARAADFIQAHFESLGLTPAFATSELAADGTEVLTPRSSFRQPFGVGEATRAVTTEMSVDTEPLVHGVDFSVLAYSGSGEINAPVSFAGYAIVSGPGGYLGFDPNTRFEGRVVLCLAYEPMDDDGNSQWQDEGFSHHSAMTHKASALIRRGASAVLIVAPPQANDPRADLLETIDSTRLGRPGLNARVLRFDAPVVQVTPELAQRILDRTGDPDLTLDALVRRANASAVAMPLGESPISMNIQMGTTSTETFNVGAVLPGVGDLAGEIVVIGAHYDHVGYGRQGSARRDASGDLHPGADDNASGTTGMMLIAQQLTERVRTLPREQPRRTFMFLAFSAEEMGLLGSIHYTKQPAEPMADHTLMLNLDMIGRLENEPLEIGNLKSAPDLEAFVEPFFESSGLVIARDTSVGNGRSDHASFDAVEVPNLFFFTGLHPDYHAPGDTADKIDDEGATRVALLVADIAMAYAVRPDPFVHRRAATSNDPANQQPTVRLGILPTNSSKGGVLVQRVFLDTSASDAGIRPDDRILTWNGEDLRSVEDLRPRLSSHKPGDVVKLTIDRDGSTIETEMTLRGIE